MSDLVDSSITLNDNTGLEKNILCDQNIFKNVKLRNGMVVKKNRPTLLVVAVLLFVVVVLGDGVGVGGAVVVVVAAAAAAACSGGCEHLAYFHYT